MRVFNFNKVIYDGHATTDLTLFIIKQRLVRVFSLFRIIPYFLLFLFNRIHLDTLYNLYYSIILENLTVSELMLFKANNIHKIDLKGFGISSNDKNNLIISYEPSFIIDLFINRNEYNVICVEYDPRSKKVTNTEWLSDKRVNSLIQKGISYISELYIYSFKAKDIMNIADYIFVYRSHELIQISNYHLTMKDKIIYNISNFKLVFFISLSFLLLLLSIILSVILSAFSSILATWIFSYLLWSLASLYVYFKVVKQNQFSIKGILNHYLGLAPNFLFQLFFILLFGSLLGFLKGLFLIIAPLLAFPLIIFIINFNNFD